MVSINAAFTAHPKKSRPQTLTKRSTVPKWTTPMMRNKHPKIKPPLNVQSNVCSIGSNKATPTNKQTNHNGKTGRLASINPSTVETKGSNVEMKETAKTIR